MVGFRGGSALLMPFAPLEGVRRGCRDRVSTAAGAVRPTRAGSAASSTPSASRSTARAAAAGPGAYPLRAPPPPAHARGRVGERLDLGVRAMNMFTTACRGQRLGVFAGSGVGKSVLLSMLARDVAATCGRRPDRRTRPRGARVHRGDLGEEGLARAVVVVATSDEPALKRRQAAYMTMAIAEYPARPGPGGAVPDGLGHPLRHGPARDRPGGRRAADHQGLHADRLHRAAQAAGAGRARHRSRAPITGLFTVLVDGDDHNEPIADAVRGILDGHIVMERAIAERGRFPAINVLKSISRTMPGQPTGGARRSPGRAVLSAYANMEELIRIGAYRPGRAPQIDQAIAPTIRSRTSWGSSRKN